MIRSAGRVAVPHGAVSPRLWFLGHSPTAKPGGPPEPNVETSAVARGQGVSPGNVQPGDLVFPSSGHVGTYIGDGKVVHAPETGRNAEITEYTEGYGGGYGVRRVLTDG